MKKSIKRLDAGELLDLISQQWADAKDISKIGYIGYSKALEIRQTIEENIIANGKRCPCSKLVPMEMVIDYFGINVSYLKKVARQK